MRLITGEQISLFDLINNHTFPLQHKDSVERRGKDKAGLLEGLKTSALSCTRCNLRSSCSKVVFGEGNADARLLLVGEAPGADEDRLGIPFVGRAGKLLDRILEAASIKREEIYITNVVKCRPPSNRLPVQSETAACLPHLKEQIELIEPEIIVCLGALATRTLIDKNASISRSRGTWHEKGGCRIIATFHPAALLRDPGKKKYVWEDFKEIVKYYNNPDLGG